MIEKGSAVISVMLCKASSPPTLSSSKDNPPSSTPQPMVCHLGEMRAFLVAMLFITNIPESADVTKNMIIITIVRILANVLSGRYSKKRNIRASGSPAKLLSAPLAIFISKYIALFPKTVIHTKLKSVGIIRTAATNSRIVRPFDILAIKIPTYGDQEIHHAQ